MKMNALEKLFVNSPTHGAGVNRLVDTMLQHMPWQKGQTYLDVGCGVGFAAEHARRRGLKVTGVDVDYDQIAIAREAYPNVNFLVNDATNLLVPDESHDIVATYKMLHHISDWYEAISEMLRVLKPGGYLIFVDIDLPGVISRPVVDVLHVQDCDILHESRHALFKQIVAQKPLSAGANPATR